MDERGRFFVSFFTELPMLFGPDGGFVTTISRFGSGPGELRMPMLYHAARDTAWFLDSFNGRLSALRLDGNQARDAGSRLLRHFPTIPLGVIRLTGGTTIVNGNITSAERVGLPLHRVDANDQVTSFGTDTPEYRADRPAAAFRGIAPTADGGFWVVVPNRYEIERYDSDGTLTARWARTVPWFTPHEGDQVTSPELPPQPKATAVGVDGQGRVWTLVHVADPRFREAFGPSPGRGLVDLHTRSLYFDTVVEVFDPRQGRIVASRKFDGVLSIAVNGVANGILAAEERRLPSDHLQLVIWRLEVHGAGVRSP